tara:strand:+ start:147 stop:1082 length:936 start_codon:yes stop_codon:yes gene_type:complete
MTNKKIQWGFPPSDNISLDDCEWYHIMEIPGIEGLTDGVFDCRDDIGNILGNLDFKNKKVINLGPSTGYLSFEAERRGANVTSIDLSVNSEERDWTPIADQDWKANLTSFMSDEKRRRNAFWYAHKALNSKSKLIISHINNLPEEVEMHDIGIIFSVLLHIRDPFLALQRMCSHVNEKIVITELGQYPTYAFRLLPASMVISIKDSIANFLEKNSSFLGKLPNFINKRLFRNRPDLRFLPQHGRIASKWWAFTPEAIIAMLKVLGFEKTKVNYHYYKSASKNNDGSKVWNFTVIGERTIPIEKCEYHYDAN